MSDGTSFHRILWDDEDGIHTKRCFGPDAKIRRVVMCSGKIYYDLYEERQKAWPHGSHLMRLEQLYPFPKRPLPRVLSGSKMPILSVSGRTAQQRVMVLCTGTD